MSNSQFCIQQRQKEQQRLKKLLMFGFASSTVLHSILAYALPRWSFESPQVVEEPIEIMIVDKPKPKPKPTSVKPPPVQAQTPSPPVKPPPVQAQTPPPKPVPKTPEPKPKKVLTTPTPAPSPPIVPAPVEKTARPSSSSSNITAPNRSSLTSTESSNSPDVPDPTVATNSPPSRPEASSEPAEGISCIDNCEPEYPSSLEGIEGSAGVKLTIDRNGSVIGAELVTTDSNAQVNRQALLAARQMQFSSPGDSAASVRVKIDFTVEGSEYDRARREEQQEEAARQEQLEAEQQAKQEQLEREQARQQQQQQESTPPLPEAKPSPKPLPTLSPEELDEERLRKFQERMKNYQED